MLKDTVSSTEIIYTTFTHNLHYFLFLFTLPRHYIKLKMLQKWTKKLFVSMFGYNSARFLDRNLVSRQITAAGNQQFERA